MQHLSQLPLPSTTPPTDSVVSVLGWVVAILATAFLGYWVRSEKDKNKQYKRLIDAYVDQVTKLENKVSGKEEEIRDLNEQRLADERKQGDDAKALADFILRRERARPPSDHPDADDEDFRDIPTGVAVEIVKRSGEPPKALPRPAEPAYRPRQHSRPLVEINDPRPPRKPR